MRAAGVLSAIALVLVGATGRADLPAPVKRVVDFEADVATGYAAVCVEQRTAPWLELQRSARNGRNSRRRTTVSERRFRRFQDNFIVVVTQAAQKIANSTG